MSSLRVKTINGEFATGEYAEYLDQDIAAWGEVLNFPINKSIPVPDHYPALGACADFLKQNKGLCCRLMGLDNNPSMLQQMKMLKRIIQWDARY